MTPTEITQGVLMYFVLPLWLLAGFADYLCHRATNIETTTGAKESLLHLLQFAEMAVPILAAMFLEINAGIILLMAVCLVLHEATAFWDVSYAVTRRNVTPFEQHVHSFLEMLPLMALLMIVVLHWPQSAALVGVGNEPARFALVVKHGPPPSWTYVGIVLSLVLLFDLLPFVEELIRGLRANHGALVPPRRDRSQTAEAAGPQP
jgi:hypothetical protein